MCDENSDSTMLSIKDSDRSTRLRWSANVSTEPTLRKFVGRALPRRSPKDPHAIRGLSCPPSRALIGSVALRLFQRVAGT